MFALAARHDATAVNPVRDTSPIRIQQKRARALTVTEANHLLERLHVSERARALDLPELVEFMLATGCRIGEACAARYGNNSEGKLLLDLDAGTWEVNATIVREDGIGLFIQERPKSTAGWRVLALPPSAVEMLRRRASQLRLKAPHGIVFGSPTAKALRDPSNTPGDLREVLDAIDCPTCRGTARIPDGRGGSKRCPDAGPFAWVHSHTFRKTVATRLDDAGCTPREVADQLGHSKPSMTMDVYMGRNVVSARAAALLDRSLRGKPGS
jgi:integrase